MREKKSVKCAFIGLGNVGTGADEAAAPSNRVETKEIEKKRRVDQFAVTGNRRTRKGKERKGGGPVERRREQWQRIGHYQQQPKKEKEKKRQDPRRENFLGRLMSIVVRRHRGERPVFFFFSFTFFSPGIASITGRQAGRQAKYFSRFLPRLNCSMILNCARLNSTDFHLLLFPIRRFYFY